MLLTLLSILLIYLTFGEPIFRKMEYSKLMRRLQANTPSALANFYRNEVLRNWLQAVYLFTILLAFGFSISQLGIRTIHWNKYLALAWFWKALFIFLMVFYVYVIYVVPCIFSRIHPKARKMITKILADMKHLSPKNVKEYSWWSVHLFNSVVEEVMYRGFIWFFLPILFPNISFIVMFLISACIDAARFYQRMAIARLVFYSAICLFSVYVLSDSLYIPIAMGIMRYLKLFMVPWSYVTDDDQKNAIGFVVGR